MASAVLETPEATPMTFDDRLCEWIDGKAVEKLMGVQETRLTNLLGYLLRGHVVEHGLGHVENEMLFDFGEAGRPKRRPDVAFVSEQRWPTTRKLTSANAWAVVPDLVVEVVSPSNSANEVEGKIAEYLQAGVRLVWVVHPTTARIYIHDGSSTIRVVSRGGELDGGEVLPDFRLSLIELFGAEAEAV